MDNPKVSFTSRINIVNNKQFKRLPKGQYVTFLLEADAPNILKADIFNAANIRTCTGGGLKSEDDITALGFHIWDNYNNKIFKEQVKFIKKSFNHPDGGLLIGSKRLIDAPQSIKKFEKLKQILTKMTPNISWFQTMKKEYGDVEFCYSRANDTWSLLISDTNKKNNQKTSVNSLKGLLDFFEKIYISPKDKLFINGIEITKKEAPQIFRKEENPKSWYSPFLHLFHNN